MEKWLIWIVVILAFVIGRFSGMLRFRKRFYGGVLKLQNLNLEDEFLTLKFLKNVDDVLFKRPFIVFDIDREDYVELKEE